MRLIYFASAALILSGCGSHSSHNEAAEAEEHHHHNANEIVVEPEDAEKYGIEVEAAAKAPFVEVVKVSGEIMPSNADRSTVTSPTAGVVTLSKALAQGSEVRAGQTIASVSAKNVTGGDTNQGAKVALDAAKRELDRLTPLLADGIITRKEYNDALTAYESAKAAYSPRAASGTVSSPRNGVLTQLMVTDGEYVEAGQPIATVATSQKLTLRALLPSSQSAFLPRISGAVISTHGGEPIDLADAQGKLLSADVASSSDAPGYVPVYFSMANVGTVVPGSAVEVYLKGSSTADVISVPIEALTEQMGQMFVFVKIDEEGYEKKLVKVGRNDGMRSEILEGIAEGDSVVVKGATFVRLAQQSTVVPEGHSHHH